MTERELLTEARRAVRHYFGRRRALSCVLERAGYPMEHFVWPAYRRAATAPAGYEYRAARLGVVHETREILGRTEGRRFAFGLRAVGGDGGRVAGAAAPEDGRPTPLRLWCEAWPIRERQRWPWRVRILTYLIAVEGWGHYHAGRALGLGPTHAQATLAPYWTRPVGVRASRVPANTLKGG